MGNVCDSSEKSTLQGEKDNNKNIKPVGNDIEKISNGQSDRFTDTSEPKVDIQKPKLHIYDVKLMESLPNSKLLDSVGSQVEIFTKEGKLKSNYNMKKVNITNKSQQNYIHNNICPNIPISLSQSCYSCSPYNINENESGSLDGRKNKTNISQVQPKIHLMESQKGNFNLSSNMNNSFGKNTSIYIPKKDNEPDVDYETIPEKITEEDDCE